MLTAQDKVLLADLIESAGLESVMEATGRLAVTYFSERMMAQGFIDCMNVAALILAADKREAARRERS